MERPEKWILVQARDEWDRLIVSSIAKVTQPEPNRQVIEFLEPINLLDGDRLILPLWVDMSNEKT